MQPDEDGTAVIFTSRAAGCPPTDRPTSYFSKVSVYLLSVGFLGVPKKTGNRRSRTARGVGAYVHCSASCWHSCLSAIVSSATRKLGRNPVKPEGEFVSFFYPRSIFCDHILRRGDIFSAALRSQYAADWQWLSAYRIRWIYGRKRTSSTDALFYASFLGFLGLCRVVLPGCAGFYSGIYQSTNNILRQKKKSPFLVTALWWWKTSGYRCSDQSAATKKMFAIHRFLNRVNLPFYQRKSFFFKKENLLALTKGLSHPSPALLLKAFRILLVIYFYFVFSAIQFFFLLKRLFCWHGAAAAGVTRADPFGVTGRRFFFPFCCIFRIRRIPPLTAISRGLAAPAECRSLVPPPHVRFTN